MIKRLSGGVGNEPVDVLAEEAIIDNKLTWDPPTVLEKLEQKHAIVFLVKNILAYFRIHRVKVHKKKNVCDWKDDGTLSL